MSTGFAELAARSHYSFLEGASSPRELVTAAAELGIEALGLCDRNGLHGAVAFVGAARVAGIHPVIGTELDLVDGSSLRLLARGREGYHQLCRTISAAQLAGRKGQPLLDLGLDPGLAPAPSPSRPGRRHLVEPPQRPAALRPTAGPFPTGWPGLPSSRERAAGPAARVDPGALGGCTVLAGGPDSPITRALIAGDRRQAERRAGRLREAFGRDRVALLLTHHLHPADGWLAAETAALALRCGLPLLVSNTPVHATTGRKKLLDVLTAIRHRTTLDGAAAHGLLLPNAEHRLKAETELRALLSAYPEAFDHTAHLAAQCALSLDFSDVRFPGFPVPVGETAFSVLYALCQEALPQRYRPITRAVAARLQRELDVIEKTGLAEFFLIVHDIMRHARENGIPGQGRGSAADSIVAYLLGITRVDPVAHDLLFERFLTEDSRTMPDIDLDIASNDREDVIQYVYKKYGERYAAMVCNVVTYRARSASREVAKALGFRDETIDRMSRSIDTYHVDPTQRLSAAQHPAYKHPNREAEHGWEPPRTMPDTVEELSGLMDEKERTRFPLFRELTLAIADFPRHLSIHNGGMLITAQPLVDTVPIERATMPDRNVVQFDKRDIEDLGLVKMDLLGLRTLSLIKDAVADIAARHGEDLQLGTLPLDDEAVYDLICEVDTVGLFQVESRAQAQALPRVRPRNFADIVVEVAIIRPGPLQGNMVNPYINRRQGREPVVYAHPSLEPILKETLGVILFQEQILKVAMAVAGFTPAEADKLRRAMSRARSSADMEKLRAPFVKGAAVIGVGDDVANEIFRQIAAFAEFGFCKSHAAAFALTAYHTAHLKLYYPSEFYVGLFNNQPMGFYSPAVIAGDAKRHGVAMLPVDVNLSAPKAVCEEAAPKDLPDLSKTIARHRICRTHDVRLGLESVKSLGEAEAKLIVVERANGPYRSFDEFARRVGLKEEALRNLALVGAFDAFGESRRALLWRARDAHRTSPAFARPALPMPGSVAPQLPILSERERVALDYRITGIPTGPQIMRFYREELERSGVLRTIDLETHRHGERVRVAGAVVVKQHPETAKGHVFLSLEDETGMANVIIRPATYQKFKRVLDTTGAVVVSGPLQLVDGVTSVLAARLDGLDLFVELKTREWH